MINGPKYSYNDISVVAAVESEVRHRIECNPYDKNGMLPIFTAPMTSIIRQDNLDIFENNNIYPILPRTCSLETRLTNSMVNRWSAYSLTEFETYFTKDNTYLEDLIRSSKSLKMRCLIDIANGHMKFMMNLVKKSKERYGSNIEIMVGNIANPLTYLEIKRCGADYVRVGIGTGKGCITSSNCSIHYPIASLLDEIKTLKNDMGDKYPKVIADGGIRDYRDVIKALALGADYVMIGGLFAECLEAAGKVYYYDEAGNKVEYPGNTVGNVPLFRNFYGMASKEGQLDLYGEKTHTSEGISKEIQVKYSLGQWRENMTDYLRSAMSYTNTKTLQEFKDEAKVVAISQNTYKSINK